MTAGKEESDEQSTSGPQIHDSNAKIASVNGASSHASQSIDAKPYDVPAHFTTKTTPIETATAVQELSEHVRAADVDHSLPAGRSVLNLKTEAGGDYDAVRKTPSLLDSGAALRTKPASWHRQEQTSVIVKEWLRSRDTRMRGAMAVALEMEHAVAKLAYERSDPAVTQVRRKRK